MIPPLQNRLWMKSWPNIALLMNSMILYYTGVGGLTVEAYKLEITLDGKNAVSEILYEEASRLKYDLGIGYDPHRQSQYESRFFTGKIDYIRYGKI